MSQTLSEAYFHYFEEMKKVPKRVHAAGDLKLLERPKVSIVGTRKPCQYTQQMTANLAHKLASVGVVVVSGAAMGVDGQAHFGAGYANTIAVLPCGVDVRYPALHREMLERIETEGLLLSQFDDGALATNWNFVIRNELVVALGDVLVVTEALRDSGSMRSVAFAKKMGKKIYVLPHRLDESEGTMDLVKEGSAELIYDLDDFVSQFGKRTAIESDPFLKYCEEHPDYEQVLREYGEKLSLYELEGKVLVQNGKVVVL